MSSGKRIREITKAANISRQELSQTLGISLSSIAMYFNGYHKVRRILALALETCYGINSEWILHNKQPVFLKPKELKLSDDAIKLATGYMRLSKELQKVAKTVVNALHNTSR